MPRTLTLLFATLLLLPPLGHAGRGMDVCRDANGNAYFSDRGCPEDTVSEGREQLPSAQTYSGKQSIDTGALNNWEQRNKTGRTWQWQQQPATER